MNPLKKILSTGLRLSGYKISRRYDIDYESEFIALHNRVRKSTMTSIERQHALYRAVRYISDQAIEGDVVECGVWKGGSSFIIAETLNKNADTSRMLYLYDTFTGMPEPTDKDVSRSGSAFARWKERQRDTHNEWDYAPFDEVEALMRESAYPMDRIQLVKGKVEETIPSILPEKIALLRLDTDWYESTKHEMEHLFPRLVPGGIIIIDDYGHWQGARQAVDEYLAKHDIRLFLNRIDYTGRIGIKS